MIHDFPDAVGFFFRRRRPPPWGWCGLSFFFVEPHGLPLFFADPLDITIWDLRGRIDTDGCNVIKFISSHNPTMNYK
jgi:hypothetical protein